MKTTDTLLAFLLLCGSAKAATIVQTQTFSFVPAATQDLTFNRFDTLGGTRILNSVTITTSLTKTGGALYVDNDSGIGASGSISQTVTLNLGSEDVSMVSSLGQPIGTNVRALTSYFVTLGGDDGDGAGYQAGGVDWGGTTFAESTVNQTREVSSSFQGSYTGTGTFVITADGDQSINTSSVGGANGSFEPASASGFVTITYDYTSLTPVPEPGPWMMVGVGLSGALLFRRRSI